MRLTVGASALPWVAFMTWPTSAPRACTLPPRTFSTTSGAPAMAASTAATSSSDSPRTASPRDSTTAAGSPSPARTPSTAGGAAARRLPGQLVVERARRDEPGQLGHLARGDRQLGQLDAGVVGAAGEL